MSAIKPGSRVSFKNRFGQTISGRVVMRSSHPGHWVINTGGRYGTPAVVAEEDLYSSGRRGRRRNPRYTALRGVKPSRARFMVRGWGGYGGRAFEDYEDAMLFAEQMGLEKGGDWSVMQRDPGLAPFEVKKFEGRHPDAIARYETRGKKYATEVRRASSSPGYEIVDFTSGRSVGKGYYPSFTPEDAIAEAQKQVRRARDISGINMKRVFNPRKKKWIKKAIKRPGALRRKFAKWYGLKKGQKISPSMYTKGYKRAKKAGDTRTMRQINMARTLSKMRRKKKKTTRRKGKVIRVDFRRKSTRRRAANPRRRRRKAPARKGRRRRAKTRRKRR